MCFSTPSIITLTTIPTTTNPLRPAQITTWAIYLGTSWTWCIGMFLPVLVLRELGLTGFLSFAIPNIVGMTRDQAQLTLEKVGLEMGPVVERESPLPRGEVMATSPLAGAEAILPSTVTVTVSSGPETLTVPDLVGQPLAVARSTLDQLGLRLAGVSVDSAAADPDGTITRESPAAGTPVVAGTAIGLTVAGRIP